MRPFDWLNMVITVFLQRNPRIAKYVEDWIKWIKEFEELSFWECQERLLPLTITIFILVAYFS
jgi:hypothetical protein